MFRIMCKTYNKDYIPRHILHQAEIRRIDDVDMKAAVICYQNSDLKLTPVTNQLGANYHRSWIRLRALVARGIFNRLRSSIICI